MWIPKSELIELGLSEATIWRWEKAGKLRSMPGESDGREGRPSKLYELESLPTELQFKVRGRVTGDRGQVTGDTEEERAGAVAGLTENESKHTPIDERLQRLATALARFRAPEYEMKHREAVERRCVEMATLCDMLFDQFEICNSRFEKKRKSLTVKSYGSSEAGKDRAWHPDLIRLAKRTASTDPVYLEIYASAKEALTPGSLVKLAKRYQEIGPAAFIRERQTLRPEIDERFLDWDPRDRALATDRLRSSFKSFSSASIVSWGEDWLGWCRRHKVKTPFRRSEPGMPGSCYAWLYRFRKNMPQVAVTLATAGTRGVENTYNYIKRRYDDLSPREGFTMDWKTFDVDVWMNAWATKAKKPALCRLYVCNVMDLVSKAIFGFTIETVPNSKGVTRAYVNAISDAEWKSEPGFEKLRGMQLFQEKKGFVLWDNGKDFRAYSVEGREIVIKGFDLETKLKAVLSTHRVGLAVDAQFEVRHSKFYNAKSKIIEPFHNYAIGEWERSLPGFKGRKSEQKPYWYPAARRIHERCFIKGQPAKPDDLKQLPETWREVYERNKAEYGHGTPFLSADELKSAYVEFLVGYNLEPHGALKNARGEMSPIEYLNLNAAPPQMMSPFATAALLMDVRPEPLTVSRGEIAVQWRGQKFLYREVASELSDGTALMSLPEKAQVEFRYDENNLGRALIMNGGAAVCWAEEPTLMGYHASKADFDAAHAKKKEAQQVGKRYFETQLDRPDWKDEAETRSNVIPMMMAVGAEEMSEAGEEEFQPQSTQRPAEVAVMTRFDRGKRRGDAGTRGRGEGLRLAPAIEYEDEDWESGDGGTETEDRRPESDDGISDFLD